MKRHALRLAAGTLAVVLPLAAVAACGTEKKKTVAQEFTTAQDHLGDAKAASFTLRFDDAQGNLAKLMKAESDGEAPDALVDALLGGSITYVADAAGDKTFREVQGAVTNPTDIKAALDTVNLAYVVRSDKADIAEIRLVSGDLYARVDLKEVGRLAELGGAEDFDATLDEMAAEADPRLATALKDVRAGKWLKLPVAKYLDDLQGLAESVVPGGIPTAKPDAKAMNDLGVRAWESVKPYVTATDANDSSAERVIDVKVKARPALKALLGVLKAEKDLPFAQLFAEVVPSDIDEHVGDGEAKGQIRLQDSHLTQVSVDVESFRLLAKDPGTKSVAGTRVVVDVDDDADEVTAPKEVSSVDLGAMLEELMGGFFGSVMEDSVSVTGSDTFQLGG